MSLVKQLLHNTRKRADAISDLEGVFTAVFGRDAGSEPNVYHDYDVCCEMMGKMRRAIDALRAYEAERV